jgi:oligogalacturonide lyase
VDLPHPSTCDPATLIQSRYFEAEKLVNLTRRNYSLEPNCRFTPDGKRIVFRSNLFGPIRVFQVEVVKPASSKRTFITVAKP